MQVKDRDRYCALCLRSKFSLFQKACCANSSRQSEQIEILSSCSIYWHAIFISLWWFWGTEFPALSSVVRFKKPEDTVRSSASSPALERNVYSLERIAFLSDEQAGHLEATHQERDTNCGFPKPLSLFVKKLSFLRGCLDVNSECAAPNINSRSSVKWAVITLSIC